MKNKKLSVFLLVIIFIIITSLISIKIPIFCLKNDSYIVKINNEKISIPEYMIYLREQKINFEKLAGGYDIWEATIDGINTIEIAKKNALDSLIFVKVMKFEGKKLDIILTDEDKEHIIIKSEQLYQELNDFEKQEISYNIVYKVMEEAILQEKIKEYLIKKSEGLETFESIYNRLLKSITVEKNFEIWDKIN